MTEYSDIPQVNALYLESQDIEKAVGYLDNSGGMTFFTVSPGPPPDPVEGELPVPAGVPVRINVAGPNSPSLITELRASLVAREQAIASELATYGVTYAPPGR